jgi:hypothetical protein
VSRRPLVVLAAVAAALVVASAAGSATRADAPTAAVTQTIAGLDSNTGGGYEPPDVQIAAGPGFIVQMVNLAARVWRTSPGVPAQEAMTLGLGDLFGAGSDRLTDPRVLFDAPSGRWFASVSDLDTNSVLLAVSKGIDPTASWSTYTFAAPGCADQPRLGIADGIVVLAADVFSSCDEGFAPRLGSELWIVNKAQVLAGAADPASSTFGPEQSVESLAPVQSLSATGTEYAVSVEIPSSRVVHLLTIDGVPPAAVHVQQVASLPVLPLSAPPPGQEPATASGGRQPAIGTNDDRILDSVWENGKLWFSANTGCNPAGDTLLRACARVTELATATRTVNWDTNLSQAGAHLFYPAIRPDAAGNLVIVYGLSSVAVAPELVAIARMPDGTFTAPSVIAQSAGPYAGSRYGDYFGAARDPAHPELVWVTGEQGAAVPGTRGWSTSVASVQVGAPVATAPAVDHPAAPAVVAQVVLGRRGAVVRLAYKALADGAGVREKVTVRAKTTVVFSTTTASNRRRSGTIYSVPWHPAKKLHGAFSWCVTSIAADGAQSAQSCSTVTLR